MNLSRVPIPNEIKDAVFERCNGECQMCGYMNGVEYHHVYPYRQCKSHDPENIILLCEECHSLLAGDKFLIYDWKNREGRIQKILRVLEIHKLFYDENNPQVFVSKMRRWAYRNHNGCYRNELIRILTYFTLVIRLGYGLDVQVKKKGNGDLLMSWTVFE